jgi:hypothetical protein
MLRPESRFRDAADIWMVKIRSRRADSTADTYDHCLWECATDGAGSHPHMIHHRAQGR